MIQYNIGFKTWWIRIFGYGIVCKDLRHHKLLFSERNGYAKQITIGNWHFKYLTKWKK